MATRYKVLKKERRSAEHKQHRCHFCHREFGVYLMPDEAFRLAEDLQTIELIMYLFERLDADTISSDRNEAATTGRRVLSILWAIRNQVRDRLMFYYLGGVPFKQRKKQQTLNDVWREIMDVVSEWKKEHGSAP